MARRREPVPLTAFARELRAFAERHGKSGRGVQTWLRSLGIGEHRGPVSSWWNGYSVPADNAAVYHGWWRERARMGPPEWLVGARG